MRRSPAYIETPQIRLPPAVNISHQNIRGVHSEHTQNFIYPSLKCKWPIHTKLLAPNDLISLSYRTQYCVRNDNVYYELKKNRLKYLSATRPVLEDFLGFLKVSLSRHNQNLSWNEQCDRLCVHIAGKLAVLRRIRRFPEHDLFKLLFPKTIQPLFDNACRSWGNTSQESKYKLQRAQNYAARMVLGNFDFINYRGLDIFKYLNWQAVKEQFYLLNCLHSKLYIW